MKLTYLFLKDARASLMRKLAGWRSHAISVENERMLFLRIQF
jgi:hypothetical protein